jgi:uncharacterized protein YkwD
MRIIIVTLCTMALSVAGTIGANQLASNEKPVIDRAVEQIDLIQDSEVVEDRENLPTDVEYIEESKKNEDTAFEVEVDPPEAEDIIEESTVSTKEEKDIKEDKKDNKATVKTNDKIEKKKTTNKQASKKKIKVENNKTNSNTLSTSTSKDRKNNTSDYTNGFKSNSSNINVNKNIDFSNCNSTEEVVEKLQKYGYKNININNINKISSLKDVLSMVGEKGSQEKTYKPQPTKVPTKAPTKPSKTETSPSTDVSGSNQSFADEVLRLVNIERSKAGLSSLTTNSSLKAAADKRAQETKVSFSHTRPNGSKFSSVFKEYGVSYRTAGENIAYGQRSPQEVVKGWMNSPGHRANILNGSFGKIGIGVYQSNGVIYWSQLFTD